MKRSILSGPCPRRGLCYNASVVVKTAFLKDYTFSFFDVETTGLSSQNGDRICEVAILKYKNEKIIDTFQTLINPLRPISEGALAVNGITPRMLKGKPLFRE